MPILHMYNVQAWSELICPQLYNEVAEAGWGIVSYSKAPELNSSFCYWLLLP